MRKPHRKQLLAWLLTAALLLTHLPVSVLSEEVVENPIQTEILEQAEQKTDEEPVLPDSPPEETGEPIEPPVSEEPNETPEPSEPSGTMEIPADENTPDIPDQDKSETPEPSDSDIEETPSPEVPEEMPDTDSTDEPPVEETPVPEESPLPDDEEAFSVSEAILEYGYAYAAAYAESVIYEDADLTAPLFTLKEDGGVLLITEETETAFKVWWLTYADEPLSGYIAKSDIADISFSEENRQALKEQRPCGFIASDIGCMDAFVLFGELTISEEAPEATPAPEPQAPFLQTGDYAAVTTETRVYLSIDETMTEDDNGDDWQGVFTRDAVVSVESVQQDALGRDWCEIRYLYGADDADGKLIWTDTDTLFVPMDDLSPTDAHELTVTDYAYPFEPIALYASADFNLRDYNASVKTFYPGQQGLQGSSGHDSEYKQIAKLDGYGTIYATPHYLEGQTVYCLEHTMNSPGAKDNPTGPFEVVDLDGYAIKPGYSGDIYSSRTMHAIGWVLRHTYPYMIVDTGYEDSDVWSRVAGQFAIREVVKQLEGDWYVRDYWRMDEFYRASGQAPADYLEYARWLASCAIRRSGITGDIGISNKSMTMQGGSYVGTVTLTTDADLIRISRSVGNLTGNSAGSDGEYYYLRSGDTISVTSTQSTFSITAQSVSSQDEEAAFLIGIPNADIQKVIIPQYGMPAKLKEVRIEFEQPYGAVRVSKISADNGAVLSGATFELMNGAGTVLATQTTGVDGTARFDNLPAGGYTVREVGAPTGYKIAVNPSQAVTVAPGATSDIRFENDRVNGKIRIVKRDALTKEALAGAVFTVTRLSAAEGGGAVGEAVATLTTGADGTAETGWLQWGRYRVAETGVPEHYVDGGFVTEIDCTEDGKTYAVEAENEPTKGWIRLVKTDRLNGNPIEGVAFDIYENDEYGNALVAGMTTGKDGTAVSPPLRKGRYIVRERGATAGYVMEEIVLDATVRSDETTQLRATNQPVMVKLKLYKRDGDEYGGDDPNSRRRDELPQPANIDAPNTRGDGELTGAVFRVLAGAEIRDRQDNVLFKKGDTVVDALTTAGDDASAATGELWPGLYEIVEASPPVGYEPSDAHFFVDARSAASQSETAVVTYEGLKLNIIRQGVYAIVKFLGDNEIHDDAGLIETPEEGAEFELYLKKAGSYGNARAFERDYLVTNKYGYAKTKLLPYGLYVLKQVKGKEGHALKSPVEIFIRGDEDVANPPILTINNQAIRYRLKLIKTDAKTGKTVRMANTAFKLLDSDGNVVTQTVSYPTRREIDTFYTDENGEVTLPETVTRGMYFIEEVHAPQGYLIRTERLGVFVGETGDAPGEAYTLDIEIPNEPVMGRVMVEKKGLRLVRLAEQVDAFGNIVHQPVYEEGYLAGAVFELRAAEDIVGKDGTVWFHAGDVADTITTTETGKDASKELPLGRYELVEVSAPEGYLLDGAPHEVELRYENDHTAVVETNVTLGNGYLSTEITLEKEKEDLEIIMEGDHVRQALVNIPGEGFVFGLFADADMHVGEVTLLADTLVATGATDAEGKLAFVGNFPHGAYYVKELSAPDGWMLNPAKFAVTLEPEAQSGGVIRVSLPEPVHDELIYTRVTLTKTDITGQKTLPGATIEVKDEQGNVMYRETTDTNGQIPQIPVTPGTYTFKEVYAPDSYALNEAEMRFTVDADGNVTGDTTIRDDYTRFSLRKVDESGKPLSGVMFGLKKADGMLMMTAKTDAKGMATFEKVPFGTYTLVETQALPGYLKADTEIKITVDGTFVNPKEPITTVVNERQKIRGLKVDTAGQALPGAAFSLINADTGEIVDVAASDEKGEFYLTGFGYGDWIIRETVAPEGFNRVEDVLIHVDEDWKAPNTLLFTDIPNHYEFVKVDEDGCPMEGVKFALEDEDGNVLRELASGEDGIVRADDLKPGVYVIREIETQAGYHLTEETIRVVIDENYIVADELFRLVNFPEEERPKDEIQTGVDVPVTPMMLYGLISMALGAVLMFAEIIHRRDQ